MLKRVDIFTIDQEVRTQMRRCPHFAALRESNPLTHLAHIIKLHLQLLPLLFLNLFPVKLPNKATVLNASPYKKFFLGFLSRLIMIISSFLSFNKAIVENSPVRRLNPEGLKNHIAVVIKRTATFMHNSFCKDKHYCNNSKIYTLF